MPPLMLSFISSRDIACNVHITWGQNVVMPLYTVWGDSFYWHAAASLMPLFAADATPLLPLLMPLRFRYFRRQMPLIISPLSFLPPFSDAAATLSLIFAMLIAAFLRFSFHAFLLIFDAA